ncbi:MAG TPA: type II secretion system protein [Stellaceae bacterium]|nr:type II secretion system protein [Stellaceae bacterium]
MTSARQPSGGFTLIEVLVALTILGIALGVLMSALSGGLSRAGATQSEAAAAQLAQSLLADAGREAALADGEQAGALASGFRWRLAVAPYGDDDDRRAWPIAAKRVTAVVSWSDGGAERSVALTTLRLLPQAPAP